MSKGEGAKIALQFTQDITSDVSSLATAFAVSGSQLQHVDGILIAGDYQVNDVAKVDGNKKKLILNMKPLKRFNNVVGSITVKYDAALGNLAGCGGTVGSFTTDFIPTELIPKINPWQRERVSVAVALNVLATKVYYSNAYESEHITCAAILTVSVTNVGTKPL